MPARPDADPVLSLAEIEALPGNDRVRPTDGWRSYRCPLPACNGHTSAALRVNMATGGYRCHRCGATGLLAEWRTNQATGQRERAVRALDRATRPRVAIAPPTPTWSWADQWAEAVPIFDDRAIPGIAYLWGRAIVPATAAAAGVRYHPTFGTRQRLDADGVTRWRSAGPAVLFPLLSPGPGGTLALTGVQGRYIDGRETTGWRKVQTGGAGAFHTMGADDADPVAIVEGPFDALAMADGGPGWPATPAIACTRASIPAWLRARVLGRWVELALDADPAGQRGADDAEAVLTAAGARAVTRATPPHGAKDWADARLAEWRDAYRPDRWPPPPDPDDADREVEHSTPRLPAGWWPGRP
jgi:hypothetical protein